MDRAHDRRRNKKKNPTLPYRGRKSAYLTFPATNCVDRALKSDQSESRIHRRSPITGQKTSRYNPIGYAQAGAGPMAEQHFTAPPRKKKKKENAMTTWRGEYLAIKVHKRENVYIYRL